jgi:hypothetical protein
MNCGNVALAAPLEGPQASGQSPGFAVRASEKHACSSERYDLFAFLVNLKHPTSVSSSICESVAGRKKREVMVNWVLYSSNTSLLIVEPHIASQGSEMPSAHRVWCFWPTAARFPAVAVTATFLLLLGLVPADAFECDKVVLPSSLVICADPELQAIADERQQVYSEVWARLDPDQQRALKFRPPCRFLVTSRADGAVKPAPRQVEPCFWLFRSCRRRSGKGRTLPLDLGAANGRSQYNSAVHQGVDEGRSTSQLRLSGICRTGQITAPLKSWRGYATRKSPPPITCSKHAGRRDPAVPLAVALGPGALAACGSGPEEGCAKCRLRRYQCRCAAGGTWIRMSRYCSSVSTAAVAGSRGPWCGGKRAVSRGGHRRACQRHRVGRRDRGA